MPRSRKTAARSASTPDSTTPAKPANPRRSSPEAHLTHMLADLVGHLPPLGSPAGPAADLLLDTYLDAASPRQAERILNALQHAPQAALRALGWQRRCALEAARGCFPAAWAAFREAAGLDPEAPALACLEVTTLMAEGCRNEARDRAAQWAARLADSPDQDFSDLIAHLQDMARHDPAVVTSDGPDARQLVEDLLQRADAWPAPACHYRFDEKSAGLAPLPKLARLEARWARVSPFNEAASPGAWLDVLLLDPLCAHSFLVLDDMVGMLQQLPMLNPASRRALLRSFLLRAESLRRVVLDTLDAADRPLSWHHPGNRPLLTLATEHAHLLAAPGDGRVLDALRWSVGTASPADEAGLRPLLIHMLATCGHADEALALAEQASPDDSVARHGRVLALFALGRHEAARDALGDCLAARPRIGQTLLATQPRRPPRAETGKPGSYGEAWRYRETYQPYWQHSGALAWAAALVPAAQPRGEQC